MADLQRPEPIRKGGILTVIKNQNKKAFNH